MTTILAIAPSTNEASRLSALLHSLGLEHHAYSEIPHAIHHILTHPESPPNLIVLYAHQDDRTLLATVENLHRLARKSRILLLVSLAQRPLALDALKRGAHDFLCTPFQDQQLQTALLRLLESFEAKDPSRPPTLTMGLESMVGSSAAIVQLQLRGRAYSQSRQHLLLRGERGVGKTHLAFALLQAEGAPESTQRTFPFKNRQHLLRLIEQQDEGNTLIIDLPERTSGGTPLQNDLRHACEQAAHQDIRLFFCQRTGRRGRKPTLSGADESQMALLTYPPPARKAGRCRHPIWCFQSQNGDHA
jgi:ActR/RegA family two-component response regulator